MQKFIAIGRITKDLEVRYSQGDKPTCVTKFSIAINRRFKRDGEPDVDFFNCVAFGKVGELLEKYTQKGSKISIVGELKNGSYTNKEGAKVYTMDINVNEVEFLDSKASSNENQENNQPKGNDGFMNIPDGIDEELPFN